MVSAYGGGGLQYVSDTVLCQNRQLSRNQSFTIYKDATKGMKNIHPWNQKNSQWLERLNVTAGGWITLRRKPDFSVPSVVAETENASTLAVLFFFNVQMVLFYCNFLKIKQCIITCSHAVVCGSLWHTFGKCWSPFETHCLLGPVILLAGGGGHSVILCRLSTYTLLTILYIPKVASCIWDSKC